MSALLDSMDDATVGAMVVGLLSVRPTRDQFAALGRLVRVADASDLALLLGTKVRGARLDPATAVDRRSGT